MSLSKESMKALYAAIHTDEQRLAISKLIEEKGAPVRANLIGTQVYIDIGDKVYRVDPEGWTWT